MPEPPRRKKARLPGLGVLLVASSAGAEGPILLDVRTEAGLAGRSFRYTDPIADHVPSLADQRPADNVVPASAAFRLRLESYPLAALTRGWPAHLGLHMDLAGAWPTNVRGGPSEPALGSQAQGLLQFGAQARVPWGPVEVVPRAAWGVHGSYLSYSDGTNPPFPDVTYSYVELGGRVRAQSGSLSVEGRFGVRSLLAYGEVAGATWFPNTSGIGMVSGASVGWAFHANVSLLTSVDFVTYGLSFHPDLTSPPDRYVGGAGDQSVAITLGVCWRLPSAPPPR